MGEQNPQRRRISVELDAENAARVRQSSAVRDELGAATVKLFATNPTEAALESSQDIPGEVPGHLKTVERNFHQVQPLITEIPEHLKPGK